MDVYWSVLPEIRATLRAQQPESLLTRVLENKSKFTNTTGHDNYEECPAFVNAIKNTFVIKSLYDYEFEFSNNQVNSKDYNQEFMENNLFIRNIEQKLFTFKTPYIFFTKESLEATSLQPYMENSYVNNNCTVIPGKFNIYKWFRGFDFDCYLKNTNKFNVKEGEPLYYIQFHTNESINLKHFHMSDKLIQYFRLVVDAKSFKRNNKNLDYFYKLFKTYKLNQKIYKEIKDNL